MLTNDDLERYSRQLLLPRFSVEAQERLASSRVLIAGLGGLGSPLALYLAAAGVGSLVLADGDRLEASNLQRQVIHGEASLGSNKAQSAATALGRLNPRCEVVALEVRLEDGTIDGALDGVDLIADGTDNYPVRFLLNRASLRRGVPLVSAAAVRTEGQLATFDPRRGTACYRCLQPEEGAAGALRCSEAGVLGPVVGALGAMQALEVLKVLTDYGGDLRGRILTVDLDCWAMHTLELERRADCVDCGGFR